MPTALLLLALICLCRPAVSLAETAEELAAATLVVFNENDPDSEPLARFYAQKRGIAKERVVGLRCSAAEEISRTEYEDNIAGPLRQILTKNEWWKLRGYESPLGRAESNSIRFVALIRGIPLKISASPGWPGDVPSGPPPINQHNEASVDSELTVLGVHSKGLSGVLNNPYFRSFSRIREARLPAVMLVCRLDGPTPEMVRQMITDSIASEQEGLRGFACIDARGIKEGNYAEGDGWLNAAAVDARKRGTPVILDNGEGLFPNGYPLREASLYFGWYAEHVGGPFARPDFRFRRGAVAAHIHSFSAATVRDPKRHWVGPLLAAGAVATFGSVYEPYLTLTPHIDVFHERLRAGFTFAEAGWMSQRGLSWMTTFVGDPLYRPFQREMELKDAPQDEWSAYATGAKLWLENQEKGATALRASAKRLKSGMIMEGLGLLWLSSNNQAGAIAAFGEARRLYKNRDDIARTAIHEIIQLQALKRIPDALVLTRNQLGAAPDAPAAEVFLMFQNQMDPPPPPSVPPPAAPAPAR